MATTSSGRHRRGSMTPPPRSPLPVFSQLLLTLLLALLTAGGIDFGVDVGIGVSVANAISQSPGWPASNPTPVPIRRPRTPFNEQPPIQSPSPSFVELPPSMQPRRLTMRVVALHFLYPSARRDVTSVYASVKADQTTINTESYASPPITGDGDDDGEDGAGTVPMDEHLDLGLVRRNQVIDLSLWNRDFDADHDTLLAESQLHIANDTSWWYNRDSRQSAPDDRYTEYTLDLLFQAPSSAEQRADLQRLHVQHGDRPAVWSIDQWARQRTQRWLDSGAYHRIQYTLTVELRWDVTRPDPPSRVSCRHGSQPLRVTISDPLYSGGNVVRGYVLAYAVHRRHVRRRSRAEVLAEGGGGGGGGVGDDDDHGDTVANDHDSGERIDVNHLGASSAANDDPGAGAFGLHGDNYKALRFNDGTRENDPYSGHGQDDDMVYNVDINDGDDSRVDVATMFNWPSKQRPKTRPKHSSLFTMHQLAQAMEAAPTIPSTVASELRPNYGILLTNGTVSPTTTTTTVEVTSLKPVLPSTMYTTTTTITPEAPHPPPDYSPSPSSPLPPSDGRPQPATRLNFRFPFLRVLVVRAVVDTRVVDDNGGVLSTGTSPQPSPPSPSPPAIPAPPLKALMWWKYDSVRATRLHASDDDATATILRGTRGDSVFRHLAHLYYTPPRQSWTTVYVYTATRHGLSKYATTVECASPVPPSPPVQQILFTTQANLHSATFRFRSPQFSGGHRIFAYGVNIYWQDASKRKFDIPFDIDNAGDGVKSRRFAAYVLDARRQQRTLYPRKQNAVAHLAHLRAQRRRQQMGSDDDDDDDDDDDMSMDFEATGPPRWARYTLLHDNGRGRSNHHNDDIYGADAVDGDQPAARAWRASHTRVLPTHRLFIDPSLPYTIYNVDNDTDTYYDSSHRRRHRRHFRDVLLHAPLDDRNDNDDIDATDRSAHRAQRLGMGGCYTRDATTAQSVERRMWMLPLLRSGAQPNDTMLTSYTRYLRSRDNLRIDENFNLRKTPPPPTFTEQHFVDTDCHEMVYEVTLDDMPFDTKINIRIFGITAAGRGLSLIRHTSTTTPPPGTPEVLSVNQYSHDVMAVREGSAFTLSAAVTFQMRQYTKPIVSDSEFVNENGMHSHIGMYEVHFRLHPDDQNVHVMRKWEWDGVGDDLLHDDGKHDDTRDGISKMQRYTIRTPQLIPSKSEYALQVRVVTMSNGIIMTGNWSQPLHGVTDGANAPAVSQISFVADKLVMPDHKQDDDADHALSSKLPPVSSVPASDLTVSWCSPLSTIAGVKKTMTQYVSRYVVQRQYQRAIAADYRSGEAGAALAARGPGWGFVRPPSKEPRSQKLTMADKRAAQAAEDAARREDNNFAGHNDNDVEQADLFGHSDIRVGAGPERHLFDVEDDTIGVSSSTTASSTMKKQRKTAQKRNRFRKNPSAFNFLSDGVAQTDPTTSAWDMIYIDLDSIGEGSVTPGGQTVDQHGKIVDGHDSVNDDEAEHLRLSQSRAIEDPSLFAQRLELYRNLHHHDRHATSIDMSEYVSVRAAGRTELGQSTANAISSDDNDNGRLLGANCTVTLRQSLNADGALEYTLTFHSLTPGTRHWVRVLSQSYVDNYDLEFTDNASMYSPLLQPQYLSSARLAGSSTQYFSMSLRESKLFTFATVGPTVTGVAWQAIADTTLTKSISDATHSNRMFESSELTPCMQLNARGYCQNPTDVPAKLNIGLLKHVEQQSASSWYDWDPNIGITHLGRRRRVSDTGGVVKDVLRHYRERMPPGTAPLLQAYNKLNVTYHPDDTTIHAHAAEPDQVTASASHRRSDTRLILRITGTCFVRCSRYRSRGQAAVNAAFRGLDIDLDKQGHRGDVLMPEGEAAETARLAKVPLPPFSVHIGWDVWEPTPRGVAQAHATDPHATKKFSFKNKNNDSDNDQDDDQNDDKDKGWAKEQLEAGDQERRRPPDSLFDGYGRVLVLKWTDTEIIVVVTIGVGALAPLTVYVDRDAGIHTPTWQEQPALSRTVNGATDFKRLKRAGVPVFNTDSFFHTVGPSPAGGSSPHLQFTDMARREYSPAALALLSTKKSRMYPFINFPPPVIVPTTLRRASATRKRDRLVRRSLASVKRTIGPEIMTPYALSLSSLQLATGTSLSTKDDVDEVQRKMSAKALMAGHGSTYFTDGIVMLRLRTELADGNDVFEDSDNLIDVDADKQAVAGNVNNYFSYLLARDNSRAEMLSFVVQNVNGVKDLSMIRITYGPRRTALRARWRHRLGSAVEPSQRQLSLFRSLDDSDRYECVVVSLMRNTPMRGVDTIRCLTEVGAGTALSFSIDVGGQSTHGSDMFSYPVVPVVQSVSGCRAAREVQYHSDRHSGAHKDGLGSLLTTAVDCPVAGGVPITLAGRHFITTDNIHSDTENVFHRFDGDIGSKATEVDKTPPHLRESNRRKEEGVGDSGPDDTDAVDNVEDDAQNYVESTLAINGRGGAKAVSARLIELSSFFTVTVGGRACSHVNLLLPRYRSLAHQRQELETQPRRYHLLRGLSLVCTLPPGVGDGLLTVVTFDQLSSEARPLITYSRPVVRYIESPICSSVVVDANGNAVSSGSLSVNFDAEGSVRLTSFRSDRVTENPKVRAPWEVGSLIDCQRRDAFAKGRRLTLYGGEFGVREGSGVVHVSVGGRLCTDARTVATAHTRKIICNLPDGDGVNLDIVVTQINGRAQLLPFQISYRQCGPGEYVPPPPSTLVNKKYTSTFSLVDSDADYGHSGGHIAIERCFKCPRGRFNGINDTLHNQYSCRECPAGRFAESSGSSVCSLCAHGFFAPAGASACSSCDVGHSTSGVDGASACMRCAPGSFMPIHGSRQCIRCRPGWYGGRTGLSTCAMCIPGTFQPRDGGTTCHACPAGRYSNDTAAVACHLCGVGEHSNVVTLYMNLPEYILKVAREAEHYYALIAGDNTDPMNGEDPNPMNGVFDTNLFDTLKNKHTFAKPGALVEGTADADRVHTLINGIRQAAREASMLKVDDEVALIDSDAATTAREIARLGRMPPLPPYVHDRHFNATDQWRRFRAARARGRRAAKLLFAFYLPPALRASWWQRRLRGDFDSPLSVLRGQQNGHPSLDGLYARLRETFAELLCDHDGDNEDGVVDIDDVNDADFSHVSIDGNFDFDDAAQHVWSRSDYNRFLRRYLRSNRAQRTRPHCRLDLASYATIYALGVQFLMFGNIAAVGAASCSACLPGRVAPSRGASVCTLCAPGTVSTVVDTPEFVNVMMEDAYMTKVDKGGDDVTTYRPRHAFAHCLRCAPGHFAPQWGSPFCEPCPIGTWSSVGFNECQQCTPGRFTDRNSTIECRDCKAGRYQDGHYPPVTCKVCPAGTHSPAGSAACFDCGPGKHSKAGASDCLLCDSGFTSRLGANPECKPCEAGKMTEFAGGNHCSNCTAGRYSHSREGDIFKWCQRCSLGRHSRPGSSRCEDCAPGRYATTMGAGHCSATRPGYFADRPRTKRPHRCKPGSYSDQAASTSCSPCAAGTYARNSTSHVCAQCPPGRYSDTGARVCHRCPRGQYNSKSGQPQSACQPCKEGYMASHDQSRCHESLSYVDQDRYNIFLLGGLAGFVTLVSLAFITIWRKHKVVFVASPLFLTIFVVALMLALALQTTMPLLDASGVGCASSKIGGVLLVALANGAIFAKTWRLHRIFNRQKGRLTAIKPRSLYLRLAVPVMLQVVMLLIVNIADPTSFLSHDLQSDTSHYQSHSGGAHTVTVATSKASIVSTATPSPSSSAQRRTLLASLTPPPAPSHADGDDAVAKGVAGVGRGQSHHRPERPHIPSHRISDAHLHQLREDHDDDDLLNGYDAIAPHGDCLHHFGEIAYTSMGETVFIIVGIWLSWQIRHIRSEYNEARLLGLIIYNLAIMKVIIIGTLATYTGQHYSRTSVSTIYILAQMWMIVSPLMILLIPKMWHVFIMWYRGGNDSDYPTGAAARRRRRKRKRKLDGSNRGSPVGSPGRGQGDVNGDMELDFDDDDRDDLLKRARAQLLDPMGTRSGTTSGVNSGSNSGANSGRSSKRGSFVSNSVRSSTSHHSLQVHSDSGETVQTQMDALFESVDAITSSSSSPQRQAPGSNHDRGLSRDMLAAHSRNFGTSSNQSSLNTLPRRGSRVSSSNSVDTTRSQYSEADELLMDLYEVRQRAREEQTAMGALIEEINRTEKDITLRRKRLREHHAELVAKMDAVHNAAFEFEYKQSQAAAHPALRHALASTTKEELIAPIVESQTNSAAPTPRSSASSKLPPPLASRTLGALVESANEESEIASATPVQPVSLMRKATNAVQSLMSGSRAGHRRVTSRRSNCGETDDNFESMELSLMSNNGSDDVSIPSGSDHVQYQPPNVPPVRGAVE